LAVKGLTLYVIYLNNFIHY